jgi:hypothetical protein
VPYSKSGLLVFSYFLVVKKPQAQMFL